LITVIATHNPIEPLKFAQYEDDRMTTPLLGAVSIALLRRALDDFTVDAVAELLGADGRAAHQRGDLAGVAHALPRGERLSTLVRLFLLGEAVSEHDARIALRPLDLAAADELIARDGDGMCARVELRPYATDTHGPWWVLSDFGSDERPGPLQPDHVLGIGAASLTLAQATVRRGVRRALDLGTGCGVQALHAATHASAVVATDISARALRLAATTAQLSGQAWELRQGSLLEPVRGERFGLVVANPPFVVSPGFDRASDGYDYRDSGLTGDAASATLVSGLPELLDTDGTASLLANWIVPADGDWEGRIAGWLDEAPCDAWVWQREVAAPGEYVAMWLRDAGELPGTERWRERYDRWLSWFDREGIAAVGMGLVTLWRNDGPAPQVVCEDVPQAVQQPSGPHIADWVQRRRWLAAHDDADLLAARLRSADGVVRTQHDVVGADGWEPELVQLRQRSGMRWELGADGAIAGLVAACDGVVPLGVLVDVLAMTTGAATGAVAAAVVPVVRDLIGRGFLDVGAGER
jgi:methylase of polypeptide subunit release factors